MRAARSVAKCCGEVHAGATERKQTHSGEPRLPAAGAVIVAIVFYAALPNQLLLGPRGQWPCHRWRATRSRRSISDLHASLDEGVRGCRTTW